MASSPPTSPHTGQERRRQVRVAFSPVRRPKLRLADGVYDVLDASLDGLRLRHADPQRPVVGHRISGQLEWPDLGAPVAVAGRIVRVEPTELALALRPGPAPHRPYPRGGRPPARCRGGRAVATSESGCGSVPRRPPLATIGYQAATVTSFLAALRVARVELLVDVRAVASSRRPGFSKSRLAGTLEEAGIGYLHLRDLGTPAERARGCSRRPARAHAGDLPQASRHARRAGRAG